MLNAQVEKYKQTPWLNMTHQFWRPDFSKTI